MEIQITSKKKQKNIFLTKTQNFVCECSKIQKKRKRIKKKSSNIGGCQGYSAPPNQNFGGVENPPTPPETRPLSYCTILIVSKVTT